jgi:hypothetical protein
MPEFESGDVLPSHRLVTGGTGRYRHHQRELSA